MESLLNALSISIAAPTYPMNLLGSAYAESILSHITEIRLISSMHVLPINSILISSLQGIYIYLYLCMYFISFFFYIKSAEGAACPSLKKVLGWALARRSSQFLLVLFLLLSLLLLLALIFCCLLQFVSILFGFRLVVGFVFAFAAVFAIYFSLALMNPLY